MDPLGQPLSRQWPARGRSHHGGGWKVKGRTESWLTTNDAYRERMREYKRLVESQGAVFYTFKQTRQDTTEFVRDNGFDKMKRLYQACSERLDRWASAQGDALNTDATELARTLLAALGKHLSDTEEAFNQFIFENKEKFYGPVGPDIKEALAQTRRWERTTSELQEGGVEAQLRQWRTQEGGDFTLDLESAFNRSFDGMESFTREEEKAVKKPLEAFRDELIRQLRERLAALARQLSEAAELYSASQQRADFDRKGLEGQLE